MNEVPQKIPKNCGRSGSYTRIGTKGKVDGVRGQAKRIFAIVVPYTEAYPFEGKSDEGKLHHCV